LAKIQRNFRFLKVFLFDSFWRKGCCSSALALENAYKSQTKLGIWGRKGRQTSKAKQRKAKLSSTATHLHIVESLPDPSLYEQERARPTLADRREIHREELAQSCELDLQGRS
jgi:hypothetical protein